ALDRYPCSAVTRASTSRSISLLFRSRNSVTTATTMIFQHASCPDRLSGCDDRSGSLSYLCGESLGQIFGKVPSVEVRDSESAATLIVYARNGVSCDLLVRYC